MDHWRRRNDEDHSGGSACMSRPYRFDVFLFQVYRVKLRLDCATLDAGTIRRVHQAWLDHTVLLFRGQQARAGGPGAGHRVFRGVARSGGRRVLRKDTSRLFPNIMMISISARTARPSRAAGWRDELSSRHDPQGDAAQRHAPVFAGDPDLWRRHAVRLGLRRLRHARSRDQGRGSKATAPSITTITARRSAAVPAVSARRAKSVHPIFRTHDETGRKAIYVNRR